MERRKAIDAIAVGIGFSRHDEIQSISSCDGCNEWKV